VAVGIVLAVSYHLVSMRLQMWVTRRNVGLMPAVTVLGFIIRITLLAVILALLALFTSLNIVALAATFVVLFTILTGISIYGMISKRHSAPPSI
jgi:hypothetical protein